MSRWLLANAPALIAGFTVVVLFFAVLSIVLTAAGPNSLNLTHEQTATWIALLYAIPMLPSAYLSLRYRTPMLLTGNVFAVIFFATLGQRFGFSDLGGAVMIAGAIVLLTALLGVTDLIARWIPAPIVSGVIAGAVLPFVIEIFSSLNTSDEAGIPVEVVVMVGATLITYLVAHRVLGTRFPAIVPAFLVGVAVAAATGQLGPFPSLFHVPTFDPVAPTFSLTAIVTVTPVLVALLTVQSSIPSVIYLRGQGYDPPERLVNVLGGATTAAGSLLGPLTASLALPPTLLVAGPTAGPRELRYRALLLPIAVGISIAVFAGTASELAVLVPPVLLLTMAGLALVPALAAALEAVAAGPLVLGPLFAFAIALSEMSLFGLGPFFWSLVVGSLVSLLFEREGWKELHVAPG